MKSLFLAVFTLLLLFTCIAIGNEHESDEPAPARTNWTFTYLKDITGSRNSLREFIEMNWFVMDELAVERGLFKSYRLIENITDSAQEQDWDFIVAVEYYEDQTYSDIRQQFEEIRAGHDTVLVDGKSLRELGRIVRSERVLIH